MPNRWRRSAQFLGTLTILGALLACGDGNGAASGEADPPGRVIPGTGAVDDGDEAAARLVAQYLGLADSRQGGPVVGTGDDPAVGLFAVGNVAQPRGTTIRPFFDTANYVLNRPYFVFFLDPNLIANFEHHAFYLYVRPSDGAIFEQAVESWPVVDGTGRLVTEADRLANLIYIHEDFRFLLDPPPARQAPTLDGAQTGGLIVASEEGRRQGDIDNAAGYMQDLTGEANPLSVLWDEHPDSFGKDDFARKLRETSEGLGAGDKYFLFLATHGSAPPDSMVQIGDDLVGYAELCKLINDNVSAGHINIFNAACFGGNMDPVFLLWDAETDKAVHWFTDTDAGHPSYSMPDTIGLKCALEQMKEALDAAREDGSVTLAEIEAAMAALELTSDEILKKICDIAGIAADDPNPPAWKEDLEHDDPGDDELPRPGEPGSGGFDPAPPVVPQSLLDLIDKLRRARLADDPIQLGPLYDPDYFYNGRNHAQIIQRPPGQDLTEFNISGLTVNTLGGDDVIHLDRHRVIEVPGTAPIHSDQDGVEQFRVDDTPRFTSERLVRWTQLDRGGPLGLQAPLPGLPEIDVVEVGGTTWQVDSFFDVFFEISLGDGNDVISISTTARFAEPTRQLSGSQIDGVTATLAGTTVTLQRQGSTNVYTGTIAEPRQVGRWVLSISANSRIAGDQPSDFVSSAAGRSIEVVAVP